MRHLWTLAALTLATGASAQLERECFTGYAYDPDNGELVYTEHHDRVRDERGRATDWRITYRGPDGEVIADKTMDFSHNRFVPVFTLVHERTGDMEGIRRDGGDGDADWRMVERDGPEGERLTEPFEVTADTAADSGFHPFVKAHFARLMAGDTVHFRFAVAGSRRVLDMRARRIDDTEFEGEPAARFRAELDMFLINWFVDGLVLTYDPEDKRLLEYRGISNMQNAEGERFPVRVSYYREKPPEADAVTTACGGR